MLQKAICRLYECRLRSYGIPSKLIQHETFRNGNSPTFRDFAVLSIWNRLTSVSKFQVGLQGVLSNGTINLNRKLNDSLKSVSCSLISLKWVLDIQMPERHHWRLFKNPSISSGLLLSFNLFSSLVDRSYSSCDSHWINGIEVRLTYSSGICYAGNIPCRQCLDIEETLDNNVGH